MTLPYEVQIALRYLLARRRQALVSVISMISTVGVAVGVMALIVALALMTGLQGELRDRLLGVQPHIYVSKVGGIADYRDEVAVLGAVPGVIGAAPATFSKALVSGPAGDAFITLKGIDPELELAVTDVEPAMQAGRLGDLARYDEESPPGILIGTTLSHQLGAFVGDTVTVVTPHGTLSPMGLLPRPRRFTVVGIYELGYAEFDSAWGLIALPTAQRIFQIEVESIQLRVADIYAAPAIADAIEATPGSLYLPQDWTDLNRTLFSALWMEKVGLAIAIGLIVIVAALQIIASLVMLVMEKSADIGILKTMGASARSVMGLFMLQGLIIGLIGTSVGAIAGVAISYVADRYRLIRIPIDVYQVEYLPFVVEPGSLVLVIVVSVTICFLATVYPSRYAARLDPVEALRYT